MPTLVIQCAEALAAQYGQDQVDGYDPLFTDRFSQNNYFSAALRESGISGVAQDNDDGDENMGKCTIPEPDPNAIVDPNPEDSYDPTIIYLEPSAAHGEI